MTHKFLKEQITINKGELIYTINHIINKPEFNSVYKNINL